jgi:D-alanyl-D-alanine carboxypeptidase (penicillin-binding protein 5/6)
MLCATPHTATAQKSAAHFTATIPHGLLMEANTGAILWQNAADELIAPASMSKLMTLAVAFRALREGTVTLDDEFVMSVNAWRKGGAPSGTAAMFVPINVKATLNELLQGIIVQSGNDASICIAEGMAGGEEAFARLMEAEARRIGLEKSTFRNATGLPHPEHRMTIREIAKLARFIVREYPEYFGMFSQKTFKYRRHKFINRNPLLFSNIGVDGLKTGYLKEAGYGIAATAKKGDRRLIAVVSGLKSKRDRKSETERLLKWGFDTFGEFKVFDAGEVIGYARVWGGDSMFVPLVGGSGDLVVLLPRYPANQRLKGEIVYKGPLKPPIKQGDLVAHLRVTSTSEAVNMIPLYAARDVEKSSVAWRGFDTLVQLALGWVLI